MQEYHGTVSVGEMAEMTELQKFLDRRAWTDFEQFERRLDAQLRKIANVLKADELGHYDVAEAVISIGGVEHRRCLTAVAKTYLTSSGPVTVPRNLYRAGRGKAVCPLELRVGIIGPCTPVLARQIAFLMGHMTSTETATTFAEMGVEGPSASTCDRLPKVISGEWEENRVTWEDELRAEELVPAEATVLAVSLDGVLVPDKKAQREAKRLREEAKKQGLSKKECGPAGYKEVGCGTVTLYAPPDETKPPDERHPQRLDTVRYARAPEHKKKTLTGQLEAEADSILAARPDLELVALADGAEENWRFFDAPRWDSATKIVDHGHACEHLRNAVKACYGERVIGRAEYERLRVILRDEDGGVDDVMSALDRLDRTLRRQHHPRRRKELAKERTYFRNQRERMDYAEYQRRGLPIGSGVMEASCKTLATQRLKRSGMSWGDGKQAILTIRSLQQSERWGRGWALIAGAFRKEISIVTQHGRLRCISSLAA